MDNEELFHDEEKDQFMNEEEEQPEEENLENFDNAEEYYGFGN